MFKELIVAPMLRFVPWTVPANIITIGANLFVYFGLYLSLYPVLGSFNSLAIAGCLLLYLIGDHLDGMQAKRTGTSSALGEFCDHYLDAFNNGIIIFTMLTVFGSTNPIVIGAVIAVSYLAHMSIFYEQFKTGWLTFEKLGSLEGVLFSAILIALDSIGAVHTIYISEVIFSLTAGELLMISSAGGAALTFISTVKRTPDIKMSFWVFAFMLIILTVQSILLFNALHLFVIITLYASLYIGRIMRGHLIDGVERSTDLLTVIYFALLIFFEFLNTPYSYILSAGYLTIMIVILIVQVFSTLKVFWVWRNERSRA